MSTTLVAQPTERITLGSRESIENPVRWTSEAELAAIVLVDRGLINHRHAAHVLVTLIGAVLDPIGLDIGQVLHAIMLNDIRRQHAVAAQDVTRHSHILGVILFKEIMHIGLFPARNLPQ